MRISMPRLAAAALIDAGTFLSLETVASVYDSDAASKTFTALSITLRCAAQYSAANVGSRCHLMSVDSETPHSFAAASTVGELSSAAIAAAFLRSSLDPCPRVTVI